MGNKKQYKERKEAIPERTVDSLKPVAYPAQTDPAIKSRKDRAGQS